MIEKQKDKRIQVLLNTISSYRERLQREIEYEKVSQQQYKRVIRSYQNLVRDMNKNIPKHFVIYLFRKVRGWGGK